MTKLTDTQRVILSAAANRRDGATLPLPKSLKAKGGALAAALEGLRQKGLLEERSAARDDVAWRESEDGRRLTLFVTNAGLQELGVEPGRAAVRSKVRSKPRRRRAGRGLAVPKPKTGASRATARASTKQSLLIDLLSRKTGATIAEAVAATGWQPHSIRGAISGALKKKLGLDIASERVEDRGRVYRIVEHG
jgi:hypothetical protein